MVVRFERRKRQSFVRHAARWRHATKGLNEAVAVAEAVHETMDFDKCNTAVRADHCNWIGSAGLGFLDAVVRQRPEAQAWMRSNVLEVLSSGASEIHRR
jgi:hypothetical protein